MKKFFRGVFAVLIVLAMCACGQRGGNSTPDPATQSSPVGGVWQGTIQKDAVIGVISDSGNAQFVSNGGINFAGTVTAVSNNISGTFSVYMPTGVFNGATSLVNGTFAQAHNISALYNGIGYNGKVKLTYLTTLIAPLTGNWVNAKGNLSFLIEAGDTFTAIDNSDGCFYSGSIMAATNFYKLAFLIKNCGKAGTYAGLGFLNSPTTFMYFVSTPDGAWSEKLARR